MNKGHSLSKPLIKEVVHMNSLKQLGFSEQTLDRKILHKPAIHLNDYTYSTKNFGHEPAIP